MNRATVISIGVSVGVIGGVTFGPGLVLGLLLTSAAAGCDNNVSGVACGNVDGSAAGNAGDAAGDSQKGLSVNITVNSCPVIAALSASPTSAVVGIPVDIGAAVVDRDVGDILIFAWSGADGSFANTSAASTTYTCSTSGSKVLTLNVSDGHCDASATISLTCLASP